MTRKLPRTYLYSLFHCNLAFSLIPEEDFPYIIRNCYHPLLDLAEEGFPLGIEMPGWTLERVSELDPGFVTRLARLWAEERCEFVGSGYSQAILPLIPAEVNRWNLEAGGRLYERLLGRRPGTALVNEQTWSRGLADLYRKAGIDTVIMDWSNCRRHNRYPREHLYRPQRALGLREKVNLLWSDSIAFQKFQRCVHGELPEEEYLDYLRSNFAVSEDTGEGEGGDRAFVIYTNDAEVFDYRPGSGPSPRGEWDRVAELFRAVSGEPGVEIVTPSRVIENFAGKPGAFTPLRLDSVETPLVVKKQDKYNPLRWAATGRDSVHLNTECHRVYERLKRIEGVVEPRRLEWLREMLCSLWGSDFRTNTIDEKHMYFHNRLGWLKLETERLASEISLQRVEGARAVAGSDVSAEVETLPECCRDITIEKSCDCGEKKCGRSAITASGDVLTVKTPSVRLDLLMNKGLAVRSAVFPGVSDEPLVGTLPHGYFDDISLGADFFTGHVIHTSRDGKKTTDLVSVTDLDHSDEEGFVRVGTRMELPIGTLWKTYRVWKNEPRVDVRYRFKVNGLHASSFRTGIFTINPEAFDRGDLWYETVNGGPGPERFPLAGHTVEHDKPVSPTVSATSCLGATEGWVRVGDNEKNVEISADKSLLYSVPMLRFDELSGEDERDFFLRLTHTIGEVDDTAWWVWRGYNETEFTIRASRRKR